MKNLKRITVILFSFVLLAVLHPIRAQEQTQPKLLTDAIVAVKLYDVGNGKYLDQVNGEYVLIQDAPYKLNFFFDLNAYNNNLNDGDYFNIEIPAPYTVNNTSTIELKDGVHDITIGTAQITSNGAGQGATVKVTLKNLQDYLTATGGALVENIKGDYFVSVKVSQPANQVSVHFDDDQTATTINQMLTIKPKQVSNYSVLIANENFAKLHGVLREQAWQSDALNKSGQYLHPWSIRINARQQTAQEFVLTDVISLDHAPMQFIPETLVVKAGFFNESSFVLISPKTLVKDVDYQIEFDALYNTFKLTILNADTRLANNDLPAAYHVTYSTTAPADGSLVANTATMKIDGVDAKVTLTNTRTESTVVRESKVASGGSVQVEKGKRIIVYKQDADTAQRLAGAVFDVTSPDGQVIQITTDANGRAYTPIYADAVVAMGQFKIKEVQAPLGYVLDDTEIMVSVGNEGTIKTINNKKLLIDLAVEKKWDDHDNQDGIRPAAVEVMLAKNGIESGETLLLDQNKAWQDSFKDLPYVDDNGQRIIYSVVETTQTTGYTSEVSPLVENNELDGLYVITNTHIPETININGTKTWEDNNNQDGIRPSQVIVKLLANGTEILSKSVSVNDGWQYSFDNLPKFKNGVEINYTIQEGPVVGYVSTSQLFNLTNTHTPQVITVNGTKTWEDNNNQDGIRPEKVVIKLLADGVKVNEVDVTASNGWTYQFENLPKYKNGVEIVYTIEEGEVAGYQTVINGFDVTNKHVPSIVVISGTKTWVDQNDKDKLRPENIIVQLKANNQIVASQEVSEKTNWKYTFDNLPKYDNGKVIQYSISEVKVEGYETKVNGYDLVNTHTVKDPKPQLPNTGSEKLNGLYGAALIAAGLMLIKGKKKQ